ncbi:hypothetical protein [Paenibacillus thiaminolyticus]|uniref:hypothetical protein n=1 Tax=Paenibacillus thiaminolyticus TaxID=49283 RepID=UPI0030B95170
MYENQTFDVILGRMLERVPDDVDKREGSVIYNACAPAAWELASLYAELDVNMALSLLIPQAENISRAELLNLA